MHLERVIQRMVDDLNRRLSERQFRVVIGESVKSRLLSGGQDAAFGGRAIRRAFQFLVVDHVSDRILVAPHLASGTWVLEFDEFGSARWTEEYVHGKYLPPARDA
jgi:ATP-dependent Clp protease ATP-binding subunit ClpA